MDIPKHKYKDIHNLKLNTLEEFIQFILHTVYIYAYMYMPMYIGMQVCMCVHPSGWCWVSASTSFTTLFFMTGLLLNLELADSVILANW